MSQMVISRTPAPTAGIPLAEACSNLFDAYPAAVEVVDRNGPARSMILALPDGEEARFFILAHDAADGASSWTLGPWTADVCAIAEWACTDDMAAAIVARGVPVPPDGTMFAWRDGYTLPALLAFYADAEKDVSPYWTTMQTVDADRPAPVPQCSAGIKCWERFWGLYDAGDIIPATALVARNPGTIFWADARESLEYGCFVVARDVATLEGYVLPRGCYVHSDDLQAGGSMPMVDIVLADPGRVDMAPRVRR
jgi:hypothetical protein